MKRLMYFYLVFVFSAGVSGQSLAQDDHEDEPGTGVKGFQDNATNQIDYIYRLKKIERKSGPIFKKLPPQNLPNTKEGWQALIDSTWGAGLPTNEKLQIFDRFWDPIDWFFAGFPNLEGDWDSLRQKYRPEIEAGVSRGRFSAIINHMCFALHEAHTYAFDNSVHSTVLEPGVPLMVAGVPFFTNHFGAALTPLADSTLLVYNVVNNHPLGLERGDRIIGYDGKAWKDLYKELLSYELPLTLLFFGTTKESDEHTWLRAAGENWHLFDTIDFIKHGSTDTTHLSTSLLNTEFETITASEQLPVSGVPFPDIEHNQGISWGIVEGTNIGYIYTYVWTQEYNSNRFETAVKDLMYNYNTKGLIIDTRFDVGGQPVYEVNGLRHLFNNDVFMLVTDKRTDPYNHFGFTQAPSSFPCSYENDGIVATKDFYGKPIAILTGPSSVSVGDRFPFMASLHPYARTFGKPTNGAFSCFDNSAYNYTPAVGWTMLYANYNTYIIDNPGMYLTHTAPAVDEEVWLGPDDVANGEDTVVKAAIDWINSNIYIQYVKLSSTFIKPLIDTLTITAKVENPPNHNIEVASIIDIVDSVNVDSIPMYDDGNHGDSLAGDGLYGCYLNPVTTEDVFSVSASVTDLDSSHYRKLPNVNRFTTIGPVVYDGYNSFGISPSQPYPYFGFKLLVKNMGLVSPAKSVTAEIVLYDTFLVKYIENNNQGLGDINPGETLKSPNWYFFYIDSIPSNLDFEFKLNIYSNGDLFWQDSTKVIVGIKTVDFSVPKTYALYQNFPNPFNPSTTIEFDLPKTSEVTLRIFNILGEEVATLVSDRLSAGSYSYEWEASNLASGIYLYRLQTDKYVEIRKMVLMR